MGLRDVSAILWRERHLLELLLFKLDEEQLVLAAGRTRWLARATREVEMVLEEIRQTELYVGVQDITDKRYEEQPGFPLPGRTFFGGVSIKLWG